MTSFGDRLQFLIKSNCITQKDLADTLNVKRGSVSNWVTNRRFPDAETLIKIADYFHVTIDFLLRGDDEYLNKEYDEISSLYKKYSDLSEDNKELIDTMIQTMIKKRKDK